MSPVAFFPGCTPTDSVLARHSRRREIHQDGFESAWLCPWSWMCMQTCLCKEAHGILGTQGGNPRHQVIARVTWDEGPSWHLLLLAMILFMYLLSRSSSVSSMGTRPRTFPQCQAQGLAQSSLQVDCLNVAPVGI